MQSPDPLKIVVFDLDETLGYFSQLGIFWDIIQKYQKNNKKHTVSQVDFNKILDLFPEFVRPNIYNILLFLKTKKKNGRRRNISRILAGEESFAMNTLPRIPPVDALINSYRN